MCVCVCGCVGVGKVNEKEGKEKGKREELECVGRVISRKITRKLSSTYRCGFCVDRYGYRSIIIIIIVIAGCVFALFALQNTALRCAARFKRTPPLLVRAAFLSVLADCFVDDCCCCCCCCAVGQHGIT